MDTARVRRVAARISLLRGDTRRWYRPHARQREFHRAGSAAHERLFLAGNRVGKTLAGAAEVAFHLTGLYPAWWEGARFARPIHAWAASVSKEATRDILQAAYLGPRGVLPPALLAGKAMKSGLAGAVDLLRVRHAAGGESVLGFKSYDQGRESFQGTARDVIHLDEEPPLAVYEECLLRTLTVEGHVLLTMTPLMGLTDMVRHFTDPQPHAGKALVRAGWAEAPHLRPAALDRLRRSLRPHEARAREFGEPVAGRGLVYPVDEDALRVPRFALPATWRRCLGLDFGWSNPTAAVWLAHDVDHDIVYVTDVYAAAERVPREHAQDILRRGAWIPAVGDPAGQAVSQRDGASMMEAYAAAGMVITPADNAVEAGLMLALERMRAGTLKVFADLEPWWREFRLYHRDERGRVVKRDDHLMDATRYALVSGLPLARPPGTPRLPDRPRLRPADWRTL